MVTDEMLTVEQAAHRLQVHPETVRRLLRDGQLKGFRPGSVRFGWRIAVADVDRFMRGPSDGD